MGSLTFIEHEAVIDKDVVTQKAHYEKYEDDHPDVLDETKDAKAGDKYLALPEQKGTVTVTVKYVAEGLGAGSVQLDAFTSGGWRTFEIVNDVSDGEHEYVVGPIPLSHYGTFHAQAHNVGKKGAVGAQIARYDS